MIYGFILIIPLSNSLHLHTMTNDKYVSVEHCVDTFQCINSNDMHLCMTDMISYRVSSSLAITIVDNEFYSRKQHVP